MPTPKNDLDEFRTIREQLSETDRRIVDEYTRDLYANQKRQSELHAALFHITENEYQDILSGNRKVSRVFIKNTRVPIRVIKYASLAAMGILLFLCLAINGFADNLRGSLISVITRTQSNVVTNINYEKYPDLTGQLLPTVLPSGYECISYTSPGTSGLIYAVYVNDRHNTIEYFYYPYQATANLGNEHTSYRHIKCDYGDAYVGSTDQGGTMLYMTIDTSFIQLFFSSGSKIGEIEMVQILDGLRRQ